MKKINVPPSALESVPGIGASIAADLRAIGIMSVEELRDQDPEKLYDRSNRQAGTVQDRCLLYVFRCAVYYANGGRAREKMNWWSWKDFPATRGSNRNAQLNKSRKK